MVLVQIQPNVYSVANVILTPIDLSDPGIWDSVKTLFLRIFK